MRKRIKYNKYDAGLTFLGAVIAPSLVSILYMLVAMLIASICNVSKESLLKNEIYIFMSLFISPIAFSSLFFIINKTRKINFVRAVGLNNKINILNIVLCVVIAFVCTFGFTGIVNMLDAILIKVGFKINNDLPIEINNIGMLIGMLFMLAVLPSIFEELLFRGVIFNGLKSYGNIAAVFFSAFLFSLMHLNVEQTIYTFIVGTILGFIMLKTNNIIYPMITHFTNNAIVIISNYINTINGAKEVAYSLTFKNIIFTVMYAITAVLLIWVVVKLCLKKSKERNSKKQNNVIKIEDIEIIDNIENKDSKVYNKTNTFLWAGIFVGAFVWIVDLILGFSA